MTEIALTGLPLDYPFSGTATYARNLGSRLPEVAPDLSFRLVMRDADPPPRVDRFQRVQSPFRNLNRDAAVWARLDKLAWETWSFPLAARKADLLHSLYFAAPIVSNAPVVVTVHDLIPLLLPGYHRGRASLLYSRLMQRTVSRAARILTVSEYSKHDIVRTLGVPADRVHVTYEAADERFRSNPQAGESERLHQMYGVAARYLLYIGGAERRKNIEMLVRAWQTIAGRMREEDVSLVIVARFPPSDPLYPDIPRLVTDLGLSDSIQLVSAVDEEDKPALYRQALGLCFPSTYEGFGLTPLEAMASGTPVISSNATSLPEVMGDAGILLDPSNLGAWADAIIFLVTSEPVRASMREAGLRQAARFSWRHMAEQTVQIYRNSLQ